MNKMLYGGESAELTSKSCWDYGKLDYSKLESPYSKLESYSKLENPYSKLENPYSKLESSYTSSLTSQHFNNIKVDSQQGEPSSWSVRWWLVGRETSCWSVRWWLVGETSEGGKWPDLHNYPQTPHPDARN